MDSSRAMLRAVRRATFRARGTSRRVGYAITVWLCVLPVALAFAGRALSQDTAGSGDAVVPHAQCFARFEILLERTWFHVDVALLRLAVDGATAAAVAELRDGTKRDRELEEAVIHRYLQADHATAAMTFLVSIGSRRFLEGARDTQKTLVEQGWIRQQDADTMSADLQRRFAFLEGRGIAEGDVLHYALRGDSVRTCFVGVEGDTLLQDVRVGPERRIALLGSYFVRGTNFHDGILEQVFEACP